MKLLDELLLGAWLVELNCLKDERGSFTKTYVADAFKDMGIPFNCEEEYFSVSHRNVLRGMHFQTPPFDHAKLVYCPVGAVLDVLLDIRSGNGFGKTASIELKSSQSLAIYIPPGIAHGFKALEEQSLMVYKTSTQYAPKNDAGIAWDSFGFDWHTSDIIISTRDQTHPGLNQFVTPF